MNLQVEKMASVRLPCQLAAGGKAKSPSPTAAKTAADGGDHEGCGYGLQVLGIAEFLFRVQWLAVDFGPYRTL